MDIQVISFALALVVGFMCFALIKHTADEFDRWSKAPNARVSLRVPAAAVGVTAIFVVVLPFTR